MNNAMTAGRSATVPTLMVVNGTSHALTLDPRSSLLDVLREELGLMGCKKGCDHGQCGACTVHLDGVSVKSCTVLAVQADGSQVTTIEGIAGEGIGGTLHPVQRAFHEMHGLQCGFCTPGMIMASIDLLKENPDPSETEVREGIEGNLCRCTGYQNIVKAVQHAAAEMRGAAPGDPGSSPAAVDTAASEHVVAQS